MNKIEYPGQGMAWADFLYHRRRVIEEFVNEGKSYDAIAQLLSMDAQQVSLIYSGGHSAAEGMFSKSNLARAAIRQPTPGLRSRR
jgi:hypothetical protein